uniref:Uncharacterized protein n=1 Tax=Arundo donax TaxID=35708 RepID=A0A0A9T8M8_ARUDO
MELPSLSLLLLAVLRQAPEEISHALIIHLIISKHLAELLGLSPELLALFLHHDRPQNICNVFRRERAVLLVPCYLDADLLPHQKPGVEALIEHQRQKHQPDAAREALGDGVPAGMRQEPPDRFVGQQLGLGHPAAADESTAVDPLLEAFRQPPRRAFFCMGRQPECPEERQPGCLQAKRDCLELRACQLRFAAESRVHDGARRLPV